MEFRIFQYTLPCPDSPEELNQFLSTHKIASVQQYFSSEGDRPTLVFVVQVASQPGTSASPKSKTRINYEEVLSEDDYRLFNQLRDERKKLAEKEGVPVYKVFTNAQLASIVEAKASSINALAAVDGIGESSAKKYGSEILKHECRRTKRRRFPGTDAGRTKWRDDGFSLYSCLSGGISHGIAKRE